ncbi:glycosyltransferase family protein [Pontibacter brevis]
MLFKKGFDFYFKAFLNKAFPVLFSIWLIVQVALYFKYGIKIVYDSHRYLAYAYSFAEGTGLWYESSSILYSSYTLVIFLFLYSLNLAPFTIILFQIIISGLAAICLYKSTFLITNSQKAAFVSTLLFVLWPDLQQWNLYIHTESLFISTTIFLLYFMVRYYRCKKSPFSLAVLALLFIVTFLRPNGFFLLIAYVLSVLLSHVTGYVAGKNKYLILLCAFPVLLLLIIIASQILEVFSPVQYLLQGQIIQGYTKFTVSIDTPPAATTKQPVILQILNISLHQPFAYLRLLLLRFLFFWGQFRPYYSTLHNILIVLFFLPVYFMALRGMNQFKIPFPIVTFIATFLFLQTFMAMFISVDWDNRFVVPLLPLVFMLSATGLALKTTKVQE